MLLLQTCIKHQTKKPFILPFVYCKLTALLGMENCSTEDLVTYALAYIHQVQ
jgi:hypothetical protein